MIGVKFRKSSNSSNNEILLVFDERKVGEINIGRSPGNHIILPGTLVSRKHAFIVTANGKSTIKDLNSINGIHKKDGFELRRISELELQLSNRISIGEYILDNEPHSNEKPSDRLV